MTDSIINFAVLPDSNPATIPAGFAAVVGGDAAGMAILSGSFRGKGAGRSGMRNIVPFTVVDDLVTVECTTSLLDGDYAPGLGFIFADNTCYYLSLGKYNFVIRKGPTLNGTATALSTVSRTSANVATYKLTYKPSTGRLQAYADNVLISTATDTTYTGANIYGMVYSSGYNNFNRIVSYTGYNVNVYTVESINGGQAVYSGQTNISASLTGFSGVPTSITCTYASGTKSIPVTNISGTATSPTFTLGDRADGVDCPLDGTVLTFTFTKGTESAALTLPYRKLTDEVSLVFANAITNDISYLPYHIAAAGFTTNGGTFYYPIPAGMSDLVIDPDGSVSTTNTGTITGWFIPSTGTGAGTAQRLNVIIKDSGVLQYGVTNTLNTSNFPSITGITIAGISVSSFSGSNNSYQYTVPALVGGVVSPRIGSRTLSVTDGTKTENYDVTVLPPSTQDYVTLTSGGTGVGYIGNYVTCVAGDQIIFDTPTTRGVAINRITAAGVIQTDFGGTQTMWHINGTTGLATQLTVITESAAADTVPDNFTFTPLTTSVLNTECVSNSITVLGVTANTDVAISITGGEYAISTNGGTSWGSYTNATGNVRLGNLVRVRTNSANAHSTTATATLTIGTNSASYVVTTTAFTLSVSNIYSGAAVTLNTTTLSTATALTINGRAITPLSGTAGTYSFTAPALTEGTNIPLFGSAAAISITNGTTTVNGTVSYLPPTAQSFVTLTSVVNTIGYIGYYIPGCAIGDQIIFDSAATRSVAVNSVGADGRFLSDYSGTQTAYHVKASNGFVTRLDITTPAVIADTIPNAFGFVDVTNAALNSFIESNTFTVTGVDAGQPIPVTITGGEYAVNTGSGFGAWTTANTNVQLGWSIKVRVNTSTQFSTAANALLNVGTVTDTFTATTIDADVTPDGFTFASITNAQLSSTSTSAAVAITGFSAGTPINISVTNGTYSIDGGAFTATSGTILVGQTVAVRVNTSAIELTATTATVTIGGTPGTFTATTRAYDTVPAPFTFTAANNAALNAQVDSNIITVAGIDVGANSSISITGGQYSINGGAFTSSPGTISLGQTATVRVTASNTYATAASAVLTIGTVPATFSVTTRAADVTATAFSFSAVNGAALNAMTESATMTVAGVDSGVNVAVSVTGGEYSFFNGTIWSAYTTVAGSVQLGYLVKVRTNAPALDGQSTNVTLTVGGSQGIFTVSTGAINLTPQAFTFNALNNVELSSVNISSTATVTGISNGYDTTIAVTNGEYSFHNGITWSSYTTVSGTVRLGYQVRVRQTASTAYATGKTTTLNIGGVPGTFITTTRTALVLPTAFTLTARTNASLSETYSPSSVTVLGIDVGVQVPISITAGEYSVNSGAWTSADGTVSLNDVVEVRLDSSTDFDTTESTTLTIGGRSAVFSITTRIADTTPTNITFTATTAAAANSIVTSTAITVSGMDAGIDVSFDVLNGEASIFDGSVWSSYSNNGMIRNGYQVRLRTTTPSFTNQTKIVSFVIGTVTGVWSVDTNSNAVTVDAFTFNSIGNATINTTYDSNLITLSGMTKGTLTTVNISGGKYRAFYRNQATQWLTGANQLPFGSEIMVRLTTSDSYSTQHNAVLTVGGYSVPFRVTTKVPNIIPRPFTFNTINDAIKSESYESATVIIKGFDIGVQANVSIANGEYKIDTGSGFGAWTSAPGIAVSGSIVKVRTTAPATAETTKLVTFSVSGVSGVFTLTTRKDPIVSTVDDTVADFSIAPIVNVELNKTVESTTFTVTDINAKITVPISVSNGMYSVDNGPYTAMPGKVKQGSVVKVSGISKNSYNAVNEVTLSVGAVTKTFSITTRGEITTLNPIAFYSVTKAPVSTDIESNIITISGIDNTFPVTLSTSGGLRYRVDKGLGFGDWLTEDVVVGLGDRIQASVTSSNLFETLRIGTLTLNGANVQFRVTTGAEPTLSVFSSIARKVNTRRYRLIK